MERNEKKMKAICIKKVPNHNEFQVGFAYEYEVQKHCDIVIFDFGYGELLTIYKYVFDDYFKIKEL